MMNAKVRGRKGSLDGTLTAKANANPILATHTYEVEFADGQTANLAANAIGQNMYAQCDSEDNEFVHLAEITDHRSLSMRHSEST